MAITYKREATIMKIIKNAIKCKKCGDIIESKRVHDFVTAHAERLPLTAVTII